MPIFEFSCTKCAHRFEKVLKSPEGQEVCCPSCGSSEVKRELSSFSTGASSNTACHSGGG